MGTMGRVLLGVFVLVLCGTAAALPVGSVATPPMPHFLEMEELRATPLQVAHIILCKSVAGSQGVPIKGGLFEHKLQCTKWIKPSQALGVLASKAVPLSKFPKTLSLFSGHQNEVKDGDAFVSCHLQEGGGVNPVNTQPKGAQCSPYLDKGGMVDYLGNNYVMKLKSTEEEETDPSKMEQVFTVCRGNQPLETNTLYVVRMKMECTSWITDAKARTVLNKSEASEFVLERSLISIANAEKAASAARANKKVSEASPVSIGNSMQYVVCKLPVKERGGAGDSNAQADIMAPSDCSNFGVAADGIKFLDAKKDGKSTSGSERSTFVSVA